MTNTIQTWTNSIGSYFK